jgi:hypothetical protein
MSFVPETVIERMPTENPQYTVSPLGIDFKGDISRDEWATLGQKFGKAGRSMGFIIGDWLNYGKGRGDWGDTYTEAMRITGLENKTLRNYASVSRKVQLSLRRDNLPFEVHCKVAPIKDVEKQRKWLSLAEQEANKGTPISSRRLAKSIILDRLATQDDMVTPEADRGKKKAQLHVLRLMTFWRKLQENDWLSTASVDTIRTLMTDLQPIICIHKKLHDRVVEIEGGTPEAPETSAIGPIDGLHERPPGGGD